MERNLYLILVLLILSATGFSQDSLTNDLPVKFLITGALELGGDEVAEVYFTNGNTQSVKAGQGGSIAAGIQIQVPKIPQLHFRGTFGIKYVTTEADNAHIRLTRIPLHFSANYVIQDKIRLSAGIVSHRNIKFVADGIGKDITFTPSSGPVVEVAYKWIGLSYTIMKYTDSESNNYSANAIGVTFSGAFPQK